MGPIIKLIFLLSLIAIHVPSSQASRNTRYLNYYYRYKGYYYRYQEYYTVPAENNSTACGSSCIAGSVFTTLATQPCLICCLIVVAYFMCKCSCAACHGICKPVRPRRESDETPVLERSVRFHRRTECTNDMVLMPVIEDTPPPYSSDMQKYQPGNEKVFEEKPPGYEDIYDGAAYPAKQ
eukprot:TRINITY_DN14439_c0_g1_i1.p1 TRINITY_DN14439_c0_g1~~TRINITY_DN14439_c0_g1_i1.p1  ORF type:complete len:180 (+),score=24.19 TRINITY_DN14439_c0_g1_i1:40-579(+)